MTVRHCHTFSYVVFVVLFCTGCPCPGRGRRRRARRRRPVWGRAGSRAKQGGVVLATWARAARAAMGLRRRLLSKCRLWPATLHVPPAAERPGRRRRDLERGGLAVPHQAAKPLRSGAKNRGSERCGRIEHDAPEAERAGNCYFLPAIAGLRFRVLRELAWVFSETEARRQSAARPCGAKTLRQSERNGRGRAAAAGG